MKKKLDKYRRSHRPEKIQSPGIFILDSLSAIREFAQHDPDAIIEAFVHNSRSKEWYDFVNEVGEICSKVIIHDEAERAGIEVSVKIEPILLEEFIAARSGRDEDLCIALDHVTDPRNLGAIVRSAAFFGVDAIIVPKDRQTLLTQAAVSTAMGGFSSVELVVVTNLSQALSKIKEEGYWIIGTAVGQKSVDELIGFHKKQVLLLGAEDKGISPVIQKQCDHLVAIHSKKQSLDSLNVSVAAGILMERLSSGQKHP